MGGLNKKFIGVIILAAAVILLLSGCNTAEEYRYAGITELWKNEAASPCAARETLQLIGTDGAAVTADDSKGYGAPVLLLSPGQTAGYSVSAPEAGGYNLCADFYILHNGFNDSEISVSVNGAAALERAPLTAEWRNQTNEFPLDRHGNQIVPMQLKAERWQSERLYDYRRTTATPVMFEFLQGENTVEIELISGGNTYIGGITLLSAQELTGYAEYREQHAGAGAGSGEIKIEAERTAYKNDSSAVPAFSADINCTPYESYKNMLNTLSGLEEFRQIVYYDFSVASAGLYRLAVNYKVSNPNRTTYAKITLDGAMPFGELLHYPFAPNNQYSMEYLGSGGDAFEFYLTAGAHTLSVGVDGSLFAEGIESITSINARVTDIYLDLKKIAGAAKDPNREWNPDTDYPGVVSGLTAIGGEIGRLITLFKGFNASGANFQAVIFLQTAQNAVTALLKDPAKIANNHARLAEGGGSVLQSLSNAGYEIGYTPLDLDKFVFVPADKGISIKTRGGWDSFWEGVKKFFYSFGADYSTKSGDKTLDVWVYRSRMHIDVMQQMLDAGDFKERTGYDVNFSLLREEGKLILSNAANINPNAVIGISNFLPYEMGIRGLTCDITAFADYPEVISRFSSGAMIPLIADNRGLGLPETQDFYVLFYRKDITDRYGIQIPQTWQDVMATLPELQRYGLNFYMPLSGRSASKSIMLTAPFIYQNGGQLFNGEGTATAIGSEESINGIKMMTEMYTLYGLPQQIHSFYESFRNGSLPIGISNYEDYLKIKLAAPEIAGKWEIAPAPGVYNEQSGEIERWQSGGLTSMVMIDRGSQAEKDASWELLKWWSSAEVQSDYSNRIRSLYGKWYVWPSANLQAFGNSTIFSDTEKSVILEQWQWINEMPKVPGWYILERELSNAWNRIVIDGLNTRTVTEEAITRINKEIERKMTEFGYMQNGVLVKQYTVTTLEEVEKWKKRA